ncbi:MAG: hypothetical protein IKF80_11720 [Erysipelotrichaceae bacterium]|nr:hypothetical protein [Erysipelotrichaceae bacterium]
MSFKQYRTLDLTIFIAMYALCEYLVIKAATVWFDEPYSISIMLPLLAIVMMRWDKYCIIHAIVYALLFVFYQKGSISQYLIYIIGNLGFMGMLVYVEKVGKETIRKTFFNSFVYLFTGFLLMEVFRGIASMIFTGTSIFVIVQFIMSDMLSLVFATLALIVVRNADGVFEDQKQYLLRINSQEEKIDGGWQDE